MFPGRVYAVYPLDRDCEETIPGSSILCYVAECQSASAAAATVAYSPSDKKMPTYRDHWPIIYKMGWVEWLNSTIVLRKHFKY